VLESVNGHDLADRVRRIRRFMLLRPAAETHREEAREAKQNRRRLHCGGGRRLMIDPKWLEPKCNAPRVPPLTGTLLLTNAYYYLLLLTTAYHCLLMLTTTYYCLLLLTTAY
jgi:hypothetical protein